MMTKDSGTESTLLGPALARFAGALDEGGYPGTTREMYLSICRKFDGHLTRQQVALADLRESDVEAFLVEATAGRGLRDGGRPARRFWRRPLELLLGQLRADGLVPSLDETPVVSGPGIAEYLAFLRQHRGFSERTVERRRLHVSRFLTHIEARTEVDLQRITVDQIDGYLIAASRRLGRQSMGAVSASLRGFLRHLHMRGVVRPDLVAQVATPRLYALESMPRAVAWADIERTLATIDRSTEIGCRDYAMLALVAFCGLRACDVAALRLEHIDWRRDIIHAPRPKAGESEDVPLVPAVGEALVAYLRVRPASPHPHVFLKVNAPIRPLRDMLVSSRARFYLERAGVKAARLGSHTLRHSFA
ncbi:MAG TPA: tyrosine-type recombinase/integrase, partial [Polyangiaceae bacterium]|nr:tyrosine-type recombinase/integrase [Polyangiaceae bacterium]